MSETSGIAGDSEARDDIEVGEIVTTGVDDAGDVFVDDVIFAVDDEGTVIATDETITINTPDGDLIVDETVSVIGDDGELHVVEETRGIRKTDG